MLSRRLRVCGKTSLLPRGQLPERGHARGLTIQLSQGQGRQPLVPEGAPPARGRAALQSCSCTIVSRWHSTPGLCSCQPYFVTILACASVCAGVDRRIDVLTVAAPAANALMSFLYLAPSSLLFNRFICLRYAC